MGGESVTATFKYLKISGKRREYSMQETTEIMGSTTQKSRDVKNNKILIRMIKTLFIH